MKVIIDVLGGAIVNVDCPHDVTVIVRDYDCPDDFDERKKDEDGEEYQEIVWENS